MSEELYDEWIPGERLRAYDTPRARAERERRKTPTMNNHPKRIRVLQIHRYTDEISKDITVESLDQVPQLTEFVDEDYFVLLEYVGDNDD